MIGRAKMDDPKKPVPPPDALAVFDRAIEIAKEDGGEGMLLNALIDYRERLEQRQQTS